MLEHEHKGYEPKQDAGNPNIIIIPKEVKFYLCRLSDLVDLRDHINRGAFPISGYEGVPLTEGPVHRDDPSEQPVLYGRGLMWGVLKGIYGTRNILSGMGYGKEADMFLQMTRKKSGAQKQAEQQQEGRQ